MRLSTTPAVIVSSGYRPELPRSHRALSIAGAVVGIAIAYYALSLLGAGWIELVTEISK